MNLVTLQSVSLWLHLISVLLWIGGIAFFLLVFGPAVRGMPAGSGAVLLDHGRRSLQILTWFAVNLLLATGVLNLILRSAASGFQLGRGYTAILAIKLVLFVAMFFHYLLQTFRYGPKIAALTAQAAPEIESWPEPLLVQWRKWFVLLKINLTLGSIILLLGLGLARS